MTPPVTCRPWNPVTRKKVVPKREAPHGLPLMCRPRWIRWVHSYAWRLTKMAPPRAVRKRNILHFERSPFPSHSSPFTIVTLEQISRNVISAVRLMPSTSYGLGQSALVARIAPYPASSVPKPTASPARKIHIPSFPQLSGVRGVSAGSIAECTEAALMSSPWARGRMASQQIHRDVEDRPEADDEVPEHRARLDGRRPALRVAATRGADERDAEPDQGAEDVPAVRRDQRAEGPHVGARGDGEHVPEQSHPLIALHEEEERAETRREGEPPHRPDLLPARQGANRRDHRDARREQHERVDTRHPDRQARLGGRGPERLAEPQHEQRRDERREEHGLTADQEQDREPEIVEGGPSLGRLALGPVTAAGRRRRQDRTVRPARDRPRGRRPDGDGGRHQRIPTRKATTTSPPMIRRSTRSVCRFRVPLVILCRRP